MVTAGSQKLNEKVEEVFAELERTSLLKTDVPGWVHRYQKLPDNEVEFRDWLQFVFLPNKLSGIRLPHFEHIAPQAIKFFGDDIKKGKLLQLLIELDSLS